MSCDEVREAAAEFALDILGSAARADVAAHLLRCPACRDEVSGMQASAEELLALGPAGDGEHWVEYPGFDPDDPDAGIAPHRRRFRVAAALTAATLLAVGTAFSPQLTASGRGHRAIAAEAVLVERDQAVGTVFVYAGRPVTVGVVVRKIDAKGKLSCLVSTADGQAIGSGTIKLYRGSGYMLAVAPDLVAIPDLAQVTLVDAQGRIIANASFSAGQGSPLSTVSTVAGRPA